LRAFLLCSVYEVKFSNCHFIFRLLHVYALPFGPPFSCCALSGPAVAGPAVSLEFVPSFSAPAFSATHDATNSSVNDLARTVQLMAVSSKSHNSLFYDVLSSRHAAWSRERVNVGKDKLIDRHTVSHFTIYRLAQKVSHY